MGKLETSEFDIVNQEMLLHLPVKSLLPLIFLCCLVCLKDFCPQLDSGISSTERSGVGKHRPQYHHSHIIEERWGQSAFGLSTRAFNPTALLMMFAQDDRRWFSTHSLY